MPPKKRARTAKGAIATANSEDKHQRSKQDSKTSAIGTESSASHQVVEEEDNANIEQEPIPKAVRCGHRVRFAKQRITKSESTASAASDADADNEDEELEDEESAPAGATRASNLIDLNKPVDEIVAEYEATTGNTLGYDNEEGRAYLHVKYLFQKSCPLPSLNMHGIPNEDWLDDPQATFAEMQDTAQTVGWQPLLSERDIASDFAAMRTGRVPRSLARFVGSVKEEGEGDEGVKGEEM